MAKRNTYKQEKRFRELEKIKKKEEKKERKRHKEQEDELLESLPKNDLGMLQEESITAEHASENIVENNTGLEAD